MSKKKKVTGLIKLQIPAGKANPSPPVGPALGQHGVNIMDFCKAFNDKTSSMQPGDPVPVVITVYADRSFSFIVKTPPAAFLLKKAANVKKGSPNPLNKIGSVTMDQLKEIAEVKRPDLNAASEEAAIRIIAGTARSMGIDVPEELTADE